MVIDGLTRKVGSVVIPLVVLLGFSSLAVGQDITPPAPPDAWLLASQVVLPIESAGAPGCAEAPSLCEAKC